jgi:hypothetical protein
MAVAAPARAPAPQTAPAPKTQKPSVDQILDNLTKSDLDHDGLLQSNLAIDQLVKKANELIHKADKERGKESGAKTPPSPLNQVLGQAILTLTDAIAYLQKLKDLQIALIALRAPATAPAATPATAPKVDVHQTCKDLNLQYKALWRDLNKLKLDIKTLPIVQRLIADVILLDVESQLYSAIERIRLRTIQIGAALNLKSELDLKGH